MDKLAVFPITHDLQTVIRYRELIKDYEIKAINSFKEDGLQEQIKEINTDWSVASNINESLNDADVVLLFDNVEEYILNKYKEIYLKAQMLHKKILLSSRLFFQMNMGNNTGVEILNKSFVSDKNINCNRIKSISAPVVSVCGMGENCSKFETLLLTLKVLKKKEYNITVISGNPLVKIFGGYTLPEYLYSDSVSMEQKVYRLNNDIYELLESKESDVVLIEMPGGIMPLGKWNKNHFSEIPMVIANALEIDIGILNTYVPFHNNEREYIYLKEYCDYKYGIPLEAICMARQKVSYDIERKQYQFMYLDQEYYEKLYNRYCSTNIIKLTDEVQSENIIHKVIQLLEENAEFV